MQSQQSRQRPKPGDTSDMTPMVDVVFLLLIFFVVTASFQMQKSIAMDAHSTDAPSPIVVKPVDNESLHLNVFQDGMFQLLATTAQYETPSKQVLIRQLKQAIASMGGKADLVVKVHQDAVLQSLVDAMDAASLAGFSEIKVTQVQEIN